MLHWNIPLILLLMVRMTKTYWDDETFREIKIGPTFKEVQDKLKKVDELLC